MQIRQRPPPDILRLQRDPLALPQPVRATIQSVGAREELLPLLELVVGSGGIVGIAVSEERFAVGGEGSEFAFQAVDVGFEVAEALVGFAAGGGGNVLLFDAHLIQLHRRGVEVSLSVYT